MPPASSAFLEEERYTPAQPRSDPSEPTEPPKSETAGQTCYQNMCEVCDEHKRDIWYCSACVLSYCDECWASQAPHRKPRGGVPHEKTDLEIAQKVQKVLSPPTDNWAREQLYKADEVTSWFGQFPMYTSRIVDYPLLNHLSQRRRET